MWLSARAEELFVTFEVIFATTDQGKQPTKDRSEITEDNLIGSLSGLLIAICSDQLRW